MWTVFFMKPSDSFLLSQYRGRGRWDPTSYTGQNILLKKRSRLKLCPSSTLILSKFTRILLEYRLYFAQITGRYIGNIFGRHNVHPAPCLICLYAGMLITLSVWLTGHESVMVILASKRQVCTMNDLHEAHSQYQNKLYSKMCVTNTFTCMNLLQSKTLLVNIRWTKMGMFCYNTYSMQWVKLVHTILHVGLHPKRATHCIIIFHTEGYWSLLIVQLWSIFFHMSYNHSFQGLSIRWIVSMILSWFTNAELAQQYCHYTSDIENMSSRSFGYK